MFYDILFKLWNICYMMIILLLCCGWIENIIEVFIGALELGAFGVVGTTSLMCKFEMLTYN